MFLNWPDGPDSALREQRVEVIRSSSFGFVVRSALPLRAEIRVHVRADTLAEFGHVRSCEKDESGFLLTIVIEAETEFPPSELLSAYDPGVLAIDEFLPEEEEETNILANLE